VGKSVQSVPGLREWVGEEGVGGGGSGVSLCVAWGVEGREGVSDVDVVEELESSSSSSSSSSQESVMGVLAAFGFEEGEIERFFRDDSRPGGLLEDEMVGFLGGCEACLCSCGMLLSLLLLSRLYIYLVEKRAR